MKEEKNHKKPFIYYYVLVLLVVMLFNALVMPLFNRMRVKEVDYSTFLTMVEEGKVAQVDVYKRQI